MSPSSVRTFGLTHLALAVKNPERSLRFYQQVCGVAERFREDAFIQVQTPGARDAIVFERNRMTLANVAGSSTSASAWSIPETSMRPRPRSKRPVGR